jgi:hypothetical protein
MCTAVPVYFADSATPLPQVPRVWQKKSRHPGDRPNDRQRYVTTRIHVIQPTGRRHSCRIHDEGTQNLGTGDAGRQSAAGGRFHRDRRAVPCAHQHCQQIWCDREVPDQCNIIADDPEGPSVVMTNSLSHQVTADTIIRGTDECDRCCRGLRQPPSPSAGGSSAHRGAEGLRNRVPPN